MPALTPVLFFFSLARSTSFSSRNNAAVKAILHSRDINVVHGRLPYPGSMTRSTLHPQSTAVPQLLLVTSGGKQWRDVGHENGSAFVGGNCLSFCYFAASKSQTSAGVLGARLVPGSLGQPLRRCPCTRLVSTSATYRTYPLTLEILSFFPVADQRGRHFPALHKDKESVPRGAAGSLWHYHYLIIHGHARDGGNAK